LRFGPTDDCSIGIDPALPGLMERDADRLPAAWAEQPGGRLIFGPTMNCTIELQTSNLELIAGLLLRDPAGHPDPHSFARHQHTAVWTDRRLPHRGRSH
jgi:hypothetical protein